MKTHADIDDIKLGNALSMGRVQPSGSLEARRIKTGVMFYWRFTVDGKADRIAIGFYDAKSKHNGPTGAGRFSIEAAKRAAEAMATQHEEAVDAGLGGLRGAEARAVEEAAVKAATEAAASSTIGEAWAAYLLDRKDYWGDRHYLDHVNLSKAGGVPSKRGTDGRGVTIAGPLHQFMTLPLRDLTARGVAAWAKKEAKTRPAQARLAWRLLKAFLVWCSADDSVFKGAVTGNPAKTKKARENLGQASVKKDNLEKGQLSAWFSAVGKLGNPVISAYLQVVLLTGARPGEVMTLKWEDINVQWKGITIRDKVEGERIIPLTPYVARLIAALPRRNGWVFSSPTSKSGYLTEPTSPHRCACSTVGLEGLTLHGLRRSFKSLTEWMEIPAGVVAQLMGHKPSATAEKHYTVRPLELLALYHDKIEAWILEQAGVTFDAKVGQGALRIVAG